MKVRIFYYNLFTIMELQIIKTKIHEIRGMRVMLDFDLALMYSVENKRLKEQVKRNIERFPADFMFQLTDTEWKEVVANCDHLLPSAKFTAVKPYAFTQEGVAMLSGVLRSSTAIQVNINIMRAFVAFRQLAYSNENTQQELNNIKSQIRELIEDVESLNKDHENYETHFDDIYLALAQLAEKKNETRRRIGF